MRLDIRDQFLDDVTGSELGTTSSSGTVSARMTGSKSFSVSNAIFLWIEGLMA